MSTVNSSIELMNADIVILNVVFLLNINLSYKTASDNGAIAVIAR